MARFDVFRNPAGAGYLVDVQANLLSQLTTVVVVPLLPLASAPQQAARLNPTLVVGGEACSLLTQFIAAVPKSELKELVARLEEQGQTVLDAIDFLHQGW
jgi:toxin CcdB